MRKKLKPGESPEEIHNWWDYGINPILGYRLPGEWNSRPNFTETIKLPNNR